MAKSPGSGAAGKISRAARLFRNQKRLSQAARIADRVAKSVLISPQALGKVLQSDVILKHIETDFPDAYKSLDKGIDLAEDQVTEIYHSLFVNFGEKIAESIKLDSTMRRGGSLQQDTIDRVRRQMLKSTQAMSGTAKPTSPAAESQRKAFSLEDGRASLADSESSPEPTPPKGDSRFTEPGQSLMSGKEASEARTQANEQFERIRMGTRPPRQSGPDRFRGTREGMDPKALEALKTGVDPDEKGLLYEGRYYFRDPETGKLFSQIEDPQPEPSFFEKLLGGLRDPNYKPPAAKELPPPRPESKETFQKLFDAQRRGAAYEVEPGTSRGPDGYTERAFGDTTADRLRLASDGTVGNLQVYDGDNIVEGDLVKLDDSYVFRDKNGRLVEFSQDGQTGREISDSDFEKKVYYNYGAKPPIAVGDADLSLFPAGGQFDDAAFANIAPEIRQFSEIDSVDPDSGIIKESVPDEVVYQNLERLVSGYNDLKRLNPEAARMLLMDQFPEIKSEGARYQAVLRAMNNAADLLSEIEEVRGKGQLNPRSQADGRVGRMRPTPSDAELADANTNIERLNREIADAEIIQKNAEYVKNKVESGQETEGFDADILIDFDLANRLAQIEGNSSNPLSEMAFKFKTSGVSDGSLQIVEEVLADVEDFLSAARKERAVNNMVIIGPEDVSVADEMASGITTDPGTNVEFRGQVIRVVDQPNPANFTSSLDDSISTMPPMIGQLRTSLREAFQERGVKIPPILGTKLEKRSGASRLPSKAVVSDYTMRIEEARKSGNPRLANKLSSELASKYNRPDNVPASEVAAQQGLAAEQGFGRSNKEFLGQEIGLDNPEVAVQFQRLTAEPAPDDLTPKEIAVRNLLKERYGDDAPLTQALESIYTGKTNPELANLRERLAARDADLASREQSPALNPPVIVDPFGRQRMNTKRDRINTLRGRLGEQREDIAAQLSKANKPLIGNIDDAVQQSAGRPAAVLPEGSAGAAGDARFDNLRAAIDDAHASQDVGALTRIRSDLDKQISLSGTNVDADRRQGVIAIRDDLDRKIKELSPEASIIPGKTPEEKRQLRKEKTIEAEERDAVAAQQKDEALSKRQRTEDATDKLMLQQQYFSSFADEGINVDSVMEDPEGLDLFANTAADAEMISRLRESVAPDQIPESMAATLEARGLRLVEPGSKADQLNKKRLADSGRGAARTSPYKIVRMDDGTTYIASNLVLQDADGRLVKETVRVAFPVMTKENVPKVLGEATHFIRVSPQGAEHVGVTYDPNKVAAARRGARLGEQGSVAGTMFDPETMQQSKRSDSARLNDLADVDLSNAPANQMTYEGEPFVYDDDVAGPKKAAREDNIRSFQRKAAESSATRQQNQLNDMDDRVGAQQAIDDFEEVSDVDTPETSEQLMARQARQKGKVNEGLTDVKRKQAAEEMPEIRGSSPGNRIRNLSVALPTAAIAVAAGTGMAPDGTTAYAEEAVPEDINTAQQLAALDAGGTDALSRAERIRRLRGGRSGGLAPAAFGTYQNISP